MVLGTLVLIELKSYAHRFLTTMTTSKMVVAERKLRKTAEGKTTLQFMPSTRQRGDI